jgi:hypothetical protein
MKGVPVTIKCVPQQILLPVFGGRKAPSSMGKISTAEVLRLRVTRLCVTRSVCEALRFRMTILCEVDEKHPESWRLWDHALGNSQPTLRD